MQSTTDQTSSIFWTQYIDEKGVDWVKEHKLGKEGSQVGNAIDLALAKYYETHENRRNSEQDSREIETLKLAKKSILIAWISAFLSFVAIAVSIWVALSVKTP